MKRSVAAAAAALALAACSLSPSPVAAPRAQMAGPATRSGRIAHIVLIIQENRSFDDLFATFPGADGATTGKQGRRTVKLRSVDLLARCDFEHTRAAFIRDYGGGKMNGFVSGCGNSTPYQYVNPSQIAPYWEIAKDYVLADHLFATQGSGSFTAHQALIRGATTIDAAQNRSLIDYPSSSPWGCDAPPGTATSLLVHTKHGLEEQRHGGPFPCTNRFPSSGRYYTTLRDLLDAQSVTWKYYTPPIIRRGRSSGNLWNAFDMIHAVRYGPEWKANVSSPEKNIFTDISNGALPAMSWIVADAPNSDHPRAQTDTGPSWVASIVNAIGESDYWHSTAIVIVWDDWGGFYDHEPPPFFDKWGGLGFRVPMLVVSPYARESSPSQPGYISQTQYEFGSILKFAEETFGLGSLGTTDQRATSIGDCFDFTQKPRKFVKIRAPYSRAYFERQRPSYLPVDTE